MVDFYMMIAGGDIVTFNVNAGTIGETSIEQAIDNLQNAVGSGSLQFPLPDGQIVTADTTFFITYYDSVTPDSGMYNKGWTMYAY